MNSDKEKLRATAKAVAKIEASAKATFQRKKKITEVIPPDVTRAKAGAWLDLISPITEWAGLKGDALKHKRSLLRIQQEEVLLRIAQSVREMIRGQTELYTIPPKILVPALEKASVESAGDDVMVERWASLLASAATQVDVQPRFVGILGELAGSQAECLERVAFNAYERSIFPDSDFKDTFLEFAEYNIRSAAELAIGAVLKAKGPDAALDKIIGEFNLPGVKLALAMISRGNGEAWDFDTIHETGIRDEADLSILESLGLVRYVVIEFRSVGSREKNHSYEVSIYYHHLTQLGVDFCKVCSRSRVEGLEKIGNAARGQRARRKRRFE